MYQVLADVVLIIHLLLIIYGLLGALLYYWRPVMIWVHLPFALWVSAIEFGGWSCPLTPLENHLRHLAGEAGYSGGFIEHYLLSLIYPEAMTRTQALILGCIALGTNAAVYSCVWRSHLRQRP